MATLDEITKEKERVGEALARADAQRDKLAHQLEELEAAERVLARYGKDTQAAKTASARTPTAMKAATSARGRSRRPTTAAKPAGGRRSSSSLSDQVLAFCNGQDTTGNHRRMQRRSPEPCRCRHCPAQAGRPHRGARREALRHAFGWGGATRRGLIPDEGGSQWSGLSVERMGVLFPVLALTGCALAMDAPISAPVTCSHSAGPTSAPQIGGPAASGTASLSAF